MLCMHVHTLNKRSLLRVCGRYSRGCRISLLVMVEDFDICVWLRRLVGVAWLTSGTVKGNSVKTGEGPGSM